MNTKLKKTLAVGLTALTLSGIGGAALFAATDNSGDNQNPSSITEKQIKDNCKGRPNFSDAVTKGVIDEATATRMAEFLESNKDNAKKGMDMFADLVSAGIITADQATQLKDNGPEMNR